MPILINDDFFGLANIDTVIYDSRLSVKQEKQGTKVRSVGMCVYIDSRCVLFNILQAHPEVDLSVLGAFRRLVLEKNPEVYVDISYVSVLSVLEDYSAYIAKEDDCIKRTPGFGRFGDIEFLDDTINHSFSKELRNTIHEASTNTTAVSAI